MSVASTIESINVKLGTHILHDAFIGFYTHFGGIFM
jgi:hypothetical protein